MLLFPTMRIGEKLNQIWREVLPPENLETSRNKVIKDEINRRFKTNGGSVIVVAIADPVEGLRSTQACETEQLYMANRFVNEVQEGWGKDREVRFVIH